MAARLSRSTILGTALGVAWVLAAQADEKMAKPMPGAQERAQYHWTLHCQGCHGASAEGTPGRVPKLDGNIARFLKSTRGRAYLGRVPGVAFAELSDSEVAELLNWVLERFDGAHLPKAFAPYSSEEMRQLRQDPLISNAYMERDRVLRLIPSER